MVFPYVKSAYTDLVALSEVATRVGDRSADDLIELMRKPTTPPKKSAAKTDPASIRRIADQLVSKARFKADFDAVLATIETLPKSNLVEVAHAYLGYRGKYKTKHDAAKAIRSRRTQDALDDSRGVGHRELAP